MKFYDIALHQGETLRQILLFKDSDKNPIDLTGCSGFAQVRESPDDGYLIADMGVAIDGEAGKVTLTITSSVSAAMLEGVYAWDFALKDAEGDVTYYIGGKFKLLPSVTEVTE